MIPIDTFWQCLPYLVVSAYVRNRNMKMARLSENSLESARCCMCVDSSRRNRVNHLGGSFYLKFALLLSNF